MGTKMNKRTYFMKIGEEIIRRKSLDYVASRILEIMKNNEYLKYNDAQLDHNLIKSTITNIIDTTGVVNRNGVIIFPETIEEADDFKIDGNDQTKIVLEILSEYAPKIGKNIHSDLEFTSIELINNILNYSISHGCDPDMVLQVVGDNFGYKVERK